MLLIANLAPVLVLAVVILACLGIIDMVQLLPMAVLYVWTTARIVTHLIYVLHVQLVIIKMPPHLPMHVSHVILFRIANNAQQPMRVLHVLITFILMVLIVGHVLSIVKVVILLEIVLVVVVKMVTIFLVEIVFLVYKIVKVVVVQQPAIHAMMDIITNQQCNCVFLVS